MEVAGTRRPHRKLPLPRRSCYLLTLKPYCALRRSERFFKEDSNSIFGGFDG